MYTSVSGIDIAGLFQFITTFCSIVKQTMKVCVYLSYRAKYSQELHLPNILTLYNPYM